MRTRKTVVNEVALLVKSAQDKNMSSSGAMDIIQKKKDIYPWLTKSTVYGRLRRIKNSDSQRISSQNIEVDPCTSIVTPDPDSSLTLGGRPKGSTLLKASKLLDDLAIAKNEIAILYSKEREKNGGKLKAGRYKEIHDFVFSKYNLTDPGLSISVESIRSRVKRKSLVVDKLSNQDSPMKSVEPALLQIVLWKQEAGQPVTPAEGLSVANSLVSETSIESEIESWQESRGKKGTGVLSTK